MIAAYVMMAAAAFLGVGSILLLIAFVIAGPFALVDLHLSARGALLWDAALSVLFFIQHSGMTRATFRDRLARVIPNYYLGLVFTVASGITLLAVVLLWQGVPGVLVRLAGAPRVLARFLSAAAVLGIGWAFQAVGTADIFGLTPVRAHFRRQAVPSPKLVVQGPYLWVRHPLYACAILGIWSAPDVTSDRLLFSGLWTAWIVLGAYLEERDLATQFGAPYCQYQKEVPMLLPWRGRVGIGIGR